MSTTEWVMIGIAVLLAVLSAFLVTAEAALYGYSVTRARAEGDEDKPSQRRVILMAEDKAPYLNSMLLLRLVAEMSATVLVTFVVFSHVQPMWQRLLITIAAMTLVSFLLWGVAPRTLGRQHRHAVLVSMSPMLKLVMKLLNPLAQLLILLGNAITPGKGYAEGPFTTEAELRAMVDMAEDNDIIEDDERRMIHSVFELGDTIVREVMVPRTDVVFIEGDKTLRQAMSLALRSGFSRIPVVGENGTDDVVGLFYLKDAARRIYDNQDSQSRETVDSVMRPVSWCPDSKPVDEVLQEMQASHMHMLIVADEFGGMAGVITIEDIVEEIVGEIVDEYDQDSDEVEELPDGSYRVSSRMPIDDLGELFGLDVDDEDVDTVGGVMAKVLNRVPITGSVVIFEGLEMTAERANGRRKNQRTVLVRRAETTTDSEDQSHDDDR